MPGHSVVLAAVRPRALDALLEDLRRLDVPDSDITVTRVEVVDWSATRSSEATFVWADVLGQAWLNARPFGALPGVDVRSRASSQATAWSTAT